MGAVEDDGDVRHELADGVDGRFEVGGDPARDLRRCLRHQRLQAGERAVRVVVGPIQRRNVDARDPGQGQKGVGAGHSPEPLSGGAEAAMPAHPLEGVADLDDRFLALAQQDGIETVGDRLGVEHAGTAGDDERVGFGAIRRGRRHAGKVEHVQEVCVCELVAEADAEDVESAKVTSGLQAPKRQSSRTQLSLKVDVWREATLGQPVGTIVEDFVQDPQAEVAHPDLVQVGVNEAPLQRDRRPVLLDGIPLPSGVAAGLADAAERSLDGEGRKRRRGVVGPIPVEAGRRLVGGQDRGHCS